ncbi:MAG: tetratricopeptide repeat protein [Acidobacteriaceae bacterium]|nr:tetratricopeptide repeat protein [Acidobacteriaceae bacterium]
MKFLRLSALILGCSVFCFGANKDMIELQRDISLLQDKVDAMQRDLDTKLGELTAMMQQVQDTSQRSTAQLQDAVTNGVGRQLAPVATLGTRVDAMSDDVRSLKDALNDLSARLERMDAKMTDLKNQMQIMQNPPPAPGITGPTTGAPGQTGAPATPPAGMSADKTYTDARRDLQGGNADLAYQEFQQYLTYFPNTELAASAQYYLGEIDYNRGSYDTAIKEFDAVLERYPQNPKTADARWMKGMALLNSGQKSKAIQEFRALVQQNPRTDAARRAQVQLRQLGATTTATRRKG